MSKFSFPGNSIYDRKSNSNLGTRVFYYGLVVSNTDDIDASRITARIDGVDDNMKDVDLPFAFPMVQKFLHAVPNIGERVMIFIPDVNNPFVDRLFMGPLISQPQKLKNDNQPFSAKSALSSGIKEPNEAPSTIPESKGVYPKSEHIAIQGRDNSDIIFKPKEVLIRAGQAAITTKSGEIPKFNKINPAYIQIKHDVILNENKETTSTERGSVVNVVGNKINLLTHKNGSPRFSLNDQDENILNEELQRILKEAHPLVFGDTLLEYLKILKDAFLNHVHSYPGMKPQDLGGENGIDTYRTFNLESLLSKNIRIN